MTTSMCMDTGFLFSFFPCTTVPQFDSTPQGRNIWLWAGAADSTSELQGKAGSWIQSPAAKVTRTHRTLCCWGDIPPTRREAREGVHLSSGSFLTGKLVLTGSVSDRGHLPIPKLLMSFIIS